MKEREWPRLVTKDWASVDKRRSEDTTYDIGVSTTANNAAAASKGRASRVVKTSNTTVNNSTTLVDGGLSFPVLVGRIYSFTFLLYVQSNATADLRVGVSVPSGTTASITSGADFSNSVDNSSFLTVQTVAIAPGGVAQPHAVCVFGWAKVGTTAGSIAVTFAQNAATAVDTTMWAGSFVEYVTI